MNDDRARSRVVLSGHARPCAHSVSRVLKKRSIFPFQRGVRGGMRMCRAPSSVSVSRNWWLVESQRALSLITACTGPQPCSAIHAAARRSVAETVAAFSAACSSPVGQAGVVVDDADDLDGAGLAGAVALGAIAMSPVARHLELRQAEGVDVQQRTGLRPLIALGARRALAAPLAADAMALEDLPARRAVTA